MSNLRNSGHLPLKTPMTNKWKAQAPTSELLERQTRALEESLNKLKIAMHPDKNKSNTEPNGPIWDRGKTGPLSQYANHVLRDESRRVFDANKPTKIRVLGDEPPATVVRPSLVANLFSTKQPVTNNKSLRCGQCEKDEAKMKCLECAEAYCAGCFAHFHLRGALQRHRCVPLSESRPATPQKKKAPVGADVIFKELRFAQSKDDFLRKSTMATDVFEYHDDDLESEEGGELLHGHYDERTSAASFQQALLQWRQGGGNEKQKKPLKRNRSTHEAGVDTAHHDSNGKINTTLLPNIEFHSSKLSYGEKLLLKKFRRASKNHQEFFDQRTPMANVTAREPLSKIEEIQVNRSLPENIQLKDPNIEIEPLYDDPPTMRAEDSARTIPAEDTQNNDNQDDEDEELMRLKQQERTKSRTSTKPSSRPDSAAMRKNSTSRPSSVAMFQHPLPSLLATNPSEELKAMTDPQSRPSSAALKKPTKLDYRLPTIWNRNWKPEQSVSDGVDPKSVQIDQKSVAQFDLALDELLDETKIEMASRLDNPPEPIRPPIGEMRLLEREKPIQSPMPTPRRTSPFTFTNSSRKVDSSSSIDTGDGGFFTDVITRKVVTSPVPPPVIERSASIRSSTEHRSAIPNLVSLRKASIESLSRAPPKRSINLEETHHQIDDQSRPCSSLSSASLPVSIISSRPDFTTRPTIEQRRKVLPQTTTTTTVAAPTTTTTTKKFRVEFSKKSSPPPPPVSAMLIEGKKVTSARNSARDSDDRPTRSKLSSGVQKSHSTLKASGTSSMTSITRDENILKDESLTINDLSVNKSIHRRSANADRVPTKSRKIEFSMKDGAKWQNASLSESGPTKGVASLRHSLKTNTPRPCTPSNPTNSKVAQQFTTYDNDDGRSSRACQDVDDDECFNQLHQELCSELDMTSPGWDASLSEHVLKNLRGTEIPFNEKDLQNNLAMLEVKLRENESLQRSQTDDDLSVHEEIRNL